MRSGADLRADLNGDNLRISTAYLRISDHCRVRVKIRVRVWVRVRVRVRVGIKVRVRLGFMVCCIQTAGEGDKMRINHVIKTDQWRCAPQIRPAPHFVVSRNYMCRFLTRCMHVVEIQQAVDALVRRVTEWQLSISVDKCCVLNVGRVSCSTSLSIDGVVLPVVKSVRDLGVLVSHGLSPSLHDISNIVAKAHTRSAAIYRVFVCRMYRFSCTRISRTCGLSLNTTL